ncbi:MAG: SpoIIE family protein phosphatase [Treponemataceae bacterium]|nr:SpoIIE family protein phosphatase [Treponemataceae bacterium]
MTFSLVTLIRLVISILLPVLVSVVIYTLDKKTKFGKIRFIPKQIIIGVVFGIIAILATEYGVPVDGAVLNVRSASPLSAGLIFGWPAGLIAGFIGGIERYFSPTGDFTRIACTFGTIIAGIVGALVRKFMLDNKRPSWFYGLVVGIVTEVIHMLMVFLNNSGDIQRAFRIVQICALPMITANGISVMIALLCISFLSKRSGTIILDSGKENISQTFQRWLFIFVLVAFFVTTFSASAFQKSMAEAIAFDTLKSNLKDIENDIQDAANKNLVMYSEFLSNELSVNLSSKELTKMVEDYNLFEITFIDENGSIINSSNEKAELQIPLKDVTNEIYYAEDNYAGIINFVGMKNENYFVQIGFYPDYFEKQLEEQILSIAQYRHIGQKGFVVICNPEGEIINDTLGNVGTNISAFGDKNVKANQKEVFRTTIGDEPCFCMFSKVNDFVILVAMTEDEVFFSKQASVYMLAFMETIVFAIFFATIFVLVKVLVVKNIRKINNSLSQITDGDLNVTVDVRDNEEFASLSDDINSTVTTLKHYIDEAAARFDKDLEIAKQIQHSALPSVFPPYPNRKDFSIFASMNAAKEVGGDFYDFYLVDENHLAFVVADVSGKGIPGAMFMMTSKTLIKSFAESGLPVNEVLTNVNTQLCVNNEAGMFVTAWMGILDLQTGLIKYANAGHNPPLVKHKNGSYEYLKGKVNFVLAGMDMVKYKEQELQLQPGDKIYLYTDGVTEAHNSQNELFGEERLLESLNSTKGMSVEEICKKVKKDVDAFVADGEQFDDITMLCVRLNEINSAVGITVEPSMETVPQVADFMEAEMEKLEVSPKISMKLMIAIDEIYSNIVRYSGATEATVSIEKANNTLKLYFKDNGKPYNPLDAKDPDITASAEDRNIGGLGVFMVKKMLDNVEYKYVDNFNILTLTKNLD